MINFILFGSFFILLLLNVPIAVSLGLSSVFAMLFGHDKLSVIPTNVYSGMSKFLLLAIPFFVISGNVMAEAGISKRLTVLATRRAASPSCASLLPCSSAPSPAPARPPWRPWASS